MKFVFFGYDFMLPSVQRLIVEGHELIGIFSFPCDNIFNFNAECQALAGRLNIPFIQSPANAGHIQNFTDQDCDLFIAAGYPHKIPTNNFGDARAINIHPTYLPKGRGMMPIPRLIIDNVKEAAGFTAHKMTDKFDAGDILLQHKFDLSPAETVETYTAKIAIHAPDLVSDLIANLDKYWDSARPQEPSEALWLNMPTDQDRLMDFQKSVKDIDATGRAFGGFGALASFDDQLWIVYAYDFWQENHALPAGSIAARLSREIVIAAKDGFVVLKDPQILENPN